MPPSLVIVPPDRPRRRGGHREPCAVGAAAEVLGIPALPVKSVNDPSTVAALHARRPDLCVVVAFGQLMRKEVLSLPRLGFVNLHFSLLPRWRGAAPVQRALEAGDTTTGVSVQRVVRALDAGPIIAKRTVDIEPGERAGELRHRLADIGAALLADVVAHVAESGELIAGKPQDESAVTLAPRVERAEADAEFARSPAAFARQVRAFHPWPLVHATLTAGERKPVPVALHRVEPLDLAGVEKEPGLVLAAGKAGIDVACGDGSLRIRELQRPGGKVLDAGEFLNGFKVKPEDRFA